MEKTKQELDAKRHEVMRKAQNAVKAANEALEAANSALIEMQEMDMDEMSQINGGSAWDFVPTVVEHDYPTKP